MKITQLIYPLTIALAAMLATGCKHTPTKLTPLPEGIQPQPADTGVGGTLGGPGGAVSTDNTGANTKGGGGEQAGLNTFDNMAEDRAALAADTVHFAFDSAVIRSSEDASIQAVAAALTSDPNTKLTIEGNCDERGTEEYNRSLGERRALAAREALAKLGIDPMRIRTISYGKDKPADPGHDESAWKANRRDEFVLLHPKTGA
jgi:peptidoglycan-associated lipoprotein